VKPLRSPRFHTSGDAGEDIRQAFTDAESWDPSGVFVLATALTDSVHRPAARLLASNRTDHENIGAIAMSAAAPSSIAAPAEGSPL
jgi:hypothetical protein